VAQNFSILKAFFQGDDLVNANNGNASPGQPNSTNLNFTAGTGNTVCAGNVATTTVALTTAEAALTGNGRVALQGKPQMQPASPGTAITVRAKSPIYDFALATGAAIPARRTITDSSLCLKCHVGSLYQHGGNRVDSVELCVMCHNEASSEQNVRVGMGVTASEAYDGKVGQTYGFKTMLHAVHSSGETTHKPLVIYRTRGIYAFGPDVNAIPNWPGTSTSETDKKLVYGADPAAATSMQPHFFATAHYPRNLQDCSACHPSGFSRMPDQSKSVATTINAGAAPWDNQLDDTLQGTTTAACTSCHQSFTVIAHAEKEGFVASVLAAGRQTIINLFK
jgi:OmcA/MtrC family decaheme c-type cytochrome